MGIIGAVVAAQEIKQIEDNKKKKKTVTETAKPKEKK